MKTSSTQLGRFSTYSLQLMELIIEDFPLLAIPSEFEAILSTVSYKHNCCLVAHSPVLNNVAFGRRCEFQKLGVGWSGIGGGFWN